MFISRHTVEDVKEWKESRNVGNLLEALRDRNKTVRKAAAEALGVIKDLRAIEPLITALQDKKSDVRGAASWALGNIGDPRATEPLVLALNDKDHVVRSVAAWSLGIIGGSRAIESLTIAVIRDKVPHVRHCAARSLGYIGDPKAIEALAKAVKDNDAQVRLTAALALKVIGVAEVVKPLLTFLAYESDLDVLEHAKDLLSTIDQSQLIKALIDALKDIDQNIRFVAASALKRNNWIPIDELELAWYVVACQSWENFSKFSALPNEPIVAAIKDQDNNVRLKAIRALARAGNTNAVGQPIIDALIDIALRDKTPNVGQAAAKTLAKLGHSF